MTNSIREIKQRLDAVVEKFGSSSTNVAKLLSELASCYADLGEDAEALRLSQRSLSIREALLGPEHKEVADSLSDLAWDYWGLGNYEQAELLFRRSLAITEKLLGPEHFEIATTLNDLADLYRDQEDFASALPLCQRALAIRQKVLGREHPDVADSLTTLAQILRGLGRYSEALDACRRSLAISEKVLDADHPLLADALLAMGRVLSDLNEFPEAQSACQRALLIDEKISGPDHSAVIEDLNELAVLFGRQSRWDQCLTTVVELSRRQRYHLVSQALALSYRDALRFIQFSFESGELLHSVCARCSPRLSESAWRAGAEALALGKALLEEVRVAQATFEIEPSMGTRALLERGRAVQVQLGRLPKSGLGPARRDSLLRDLQTDLGQLERQLSERSATLAQTLRDRNLTLNDIARSLPPQAALADFIQYQRYDFTTVGTNQWKERRYTVYLTFPLANGLTNPPVDRVDLGEAAPINEAVELICKRMAAGQYAAKDLPPTLQRLSELVYSPLARHLTNVSHLIICPDGQLSRAPFEMLSHEGRFLVEDKTFSYVTSGREVVRLRDGAGVPPDADLAAGTTNGPARAGRLSHVGPALVMGGPDFDLDLSKAPSHRSAGAEQVAALGTQPSTRGSERDAKSLTAVGGKSLSRDYQGLKFKPLPGRRMRRVASPGCLGTIAFCDLAQRRGKRS